ncbi:hypothetical protein GOE05_29505 [Sinorhizobium medicae]|nr:hypothetical protein [Sinorhizobium medicae]
MKDTNVAHVGVNLASATNMPVPSTRPAGSSVTATRTAVRRGTSYRKDLVDIAA